MVLKSTEALFSKAYESTFVSAVHGSSIAPHVLSAAGTAFYNYYNTLVWVDTAILKLIIAGSWKVHMLYICMHNAYIHGKS